MRAMTTVAVSSTQPSPLPALQPESQALIVSDRLGPVFVIGSGPVGVRFVQELLQRNPHAHVKLFGNEPFAPYNRVQLSSVLAGDIDRESITYQLPCQELHPNFEYIVCAITSIDTAEHTVTDAFGQVHDYSKLILATGSRPFIPTIPGIQQKGVYTFRGLRDTDALYARLSSSKHIVVVGGGLLGIEAARALRRLNTRVTLIHQGSRLMNRQLDDEAAARLALKLQQNGIKIIVESGVRVVHGMNRVEGVTTRHGDRLDCDTVLFCTGVSCNTELALNAGIKIAQGIVVDDQLQTSAEDVYAVGECSEFNQQIFGFAGPGLDQAAVAADVISGGNARYAGSAASSRLKVANEQVFSAGEVCDFPRHGRQREIIYQTDGIYRKLVVHNGKLIGLLGIGDWPELPRIQELYQQQYQQQRKPSPWQLWLFRINGRLWLNNTSSNARNWPATAIICQCNQIPQLTLVKAIESGCASLPALADKTRAGSVCGSCKPLLQQLIGDDAPPEKDKAWFTILIASTLALLVALLVVSSPALTVPDTVQGATSLGGIWNDKFWKQVTGFTLLGLSAMGMLMSLRKRLNYKWLNQKLGEFAYWRAFHIILGLLCVTILIVHTGFHLGVNLNRYLMINFLLVIALGTFAGIAVSISHRLSPAFGLKLRKTLSWIHLIVSWPLPILLAAHILSVYYF